MSADRKAAAAALIDLWGANVAARTPADLVDATYRNHQEPDAAGGDSVKALEEWRELLEGFHSSFSETTSRVLQQVEERDLVVTHWELAATHTGEYLGHPASGRRTVWTGVSIDRFANDGRIAESWVTWNKYGFLEGLGLV